MKNNKTKKKIVVIILEGVWGSGKTSLAKELRKKYGVTIIKEPHHIRAKIRTKNKNLITEWYIHAHEQNMKKGVNMARQNHSIVIERSVLSSIAFAKLFLGKNVQSLLSHFKKSLKDFQNFDVRFLFVYLRCSNITMNLNHMKHNPYLKELTDIIFIKKIDNYVLNCLRVMKKEKLIDLIILPII